MPIDKRCNGMYTISMKTIENKIEKYRQLLIARQQRHDDMQRLRKEGKTLQEIADQFGLTRQRVWKILQDDLPEQDNASEQ